MGTNMFWNCQDIRSEGKELELYLKENNFDIVALNEMFLTKNVDFKIQGYGTIKNDHSTTIGHLVWLPFTAQMEIQTLGCLKLSTTFPTMSCLSAISIRSWKLSAVPRKQLWSNAQKYKSHLNQTYLNNDEHTHLDKAKGSTDILDRAFISPNLTKHD